MSQKASSVRARRVSQELSVIDAHPNIGLSIRSEAVMMAVKVVW